MCDDAIYPRYLHPRVTEALVDSPVVLIHGPRQCGKTTLARLVGDEEGFSYFTFDDDVQRAAARADPVGYVAETNCPLGTVIERSVSSKPPNFTSPIQALLARSWG